MGSFTRVLSTRGAQSEERTLSRGGRVSKYHGHIFYPLVPFARARQRTQLLLQPAPRASLRVLASLLIRFPPRRAMRDKRDPSLPALPVPLPPPSPRIIITAHRCLGIPTPWLSFITAASARATCARTSLTLLSRITRGIISSPPPETIVIITQVKYPGGLRILFNGLPSVLRTVHGKKSKSASS